MKSARLRSGRACNNRCSCHEGHAVVNLFDASIPVLCFVVGMFHHSGSSLSRASGGFVDAVDDGFNLFGQSVLVEVVTVIVIVVLVAVVAAIIKCTQMYSFQQLQVM